eukprot:446536_1
MSSNTKTQLSQREVCGLGAVLGFASCAVAGGVWVYQWHKRCCLREQVLQKDLRCLKERIDVEDVMTCDVNDQISVQVGSSRMTAAEIETMREVFNSKDTDQSGTILTEDLAELYEALGEPLSEEDEIANKALLDPMDTGHISFDTFVQWWCESHFKKGRNKRGRPFRLESVGVDEAFDVNKIVLKPSGQIGTRLYRVFFCYELGNGTLRKISPWHDIPLYHYRSSIEIFNFICEIPKWTRCKYEIATGEVFNPIKQDVKNGQLRNYKYGDMMFNYGAFPRTWEDPSHTPSDTGYPGDNDPIDCLEIGRRKMKTGEVSPVRVLGLLALIDSGETDYKIIAISINDPLSSLLKDIHDVEKHLPGAIDAIREYLRLYKCWTGAPPNTFAHHEDCMPRSYAMKVIKETHESWKTMREKGHSVVQRNTEEEEE